MYGPKPAPEKLVAFHPSDNDPSLHPSEQRSLAAPFQNNQIHRPGEFFRSL
jgi:hypothetical protein